jgi:DNA-binding transcriptional MerR regulator
MNQLKQTVGARETEWLKIGDVAKLTGIGIETLRFYERSGLLSRPARTDGGYQAGQSPCDEVREIVRQRLAELDTRLEQMQRYRDALARTLSQWDKRGKADGHFCGLIEEAELNTAKPASTNLRRRRK